MVKVEKKPLITNIHRFALDDGPGIRTTVFFKGCPLSCVWCHNPESIRPEKEIAFHSHLCLHCGDCLKACPLGAISMETDERVNRDCCDTCGFCADVCPSTALRMIGRYYEPSELMEILLRDHHFYDASRGGVTFSGGEPTLFPEYLSVILQELHAKGVHTAVQTCGHFDLPMFSSYLLPYLDQIYFDLKLFDPGQHKIWTGRTNEKIIENFLAITRAAGSRVTPRIPLIPGITTTNDNLTNLALFLRDIGITDCKLLPYNSGGMQKRVLLGKSLPENLAAVRADPAAEKKWDTFFQKILTFSGKIAICKEYTTTARRYGV